MYKRQVMGVLTPSRPSIIIAAVSRTAAAMSEISLRVILFPFIAFFSFKS